LTYEVVRVMCGKQQNKKKDWLYRRFEVTDQETLAEAESLIERKQIDRQDLMLLLKTYKIRNT
ncbi:hypothetical protein, partial [Bacillus paralicheniformis]